MECKKCLSCLPEYKDGELDEALNGEMNAHIRSCSDCSSELKALNFISGVIASIKVPAPPANFDELIVNRMREAPKSSFIFSPSFRFAAAAMMILTGAFFASKPYFAEKTHSGLLISESELNEFDDEIMELFYS